MLALKNTKNYNILEDERPSKAFLKGYNEVILVNKDNPDYYLTKVESKENCRLMPITEYQGINNVFHEAFQKIYS